MAEQKVIDYIVTSLKQGYADENIKVALKKSGWTENQINESFFIASNKISLNQKQKTTKNAKVREPKTLTQTNNQNTSKDVVVQPVSTKTKKGMFPKLPAIREISLSHILLYLGGLIVIMAGITYISTNWSSWASIPKILAILTPMLICFISGAWIWRKGDHKNAQIFNVVGSFLFPIFWTVLFTELKLMPMSINTSYYLGFTVSLISLLFYIFARHIYPHPIWVVMYQSAGLFCYYFLWRVIGLDGIFKPAMAWLFIVLGAFYLRLSVFYLINNMVDEMRYSNIFAMGTILIAAYRVQMEHFSSPVQVWLLALLGVGFFAYGIWQEWKKYDKTSYTAYLIGSLIVLFSLFSLTGEIVNFVRKVIVDNVDLYMWINLTMGVIFLVIGLFIDQLKKHSLMIAIQFKNIYFFISCLLILYNLYLLGLNGEKPLYEVFLVMISLVFIFISIPLRVKYFLYTGTIFFIIGVFSIGGEYFYNNVGWPLTLFVIGLISMGTGLGVGKIRQHFFSVRKS